MPYLHKSRPVWPDANERTATHHVVRGKTEHGFSIGTLGRAGCSPCAHLRLAGPANRDTGLPWGGDLDTIFPCLLFRTQRLPSLYPDGQALEEKSSGAFLFQY
jgi:hypothetical protein